MRQCDVRTPEQALAYITDCNMATVSNMAAKKSKSKHEYDRQINIAQYAVTWMKEMGIDVSSTRASEIGDDVNGVRIWAEKYEIKPKADR